MTRTAIGASAEQPRTGRAPPERWRSLAVGFSGRIQESGSLELADVLEAESLQRWADAQPAPEPFANPFRAPFAVRRRFTRFAGWVLSTTVQALYGFGDAVCVPVVGWLARHVLVPAVTACALGSKAA